jgi:hypothetical protein
VKGDDAAALAGARRGEPPPGRPGRRGASLCAGGRAPSGRTADLRRSRRGLRGARARSQCRGRVSRSGAARPRKSRLTTSISGIRPRRQGSSRRGPKAAAARGDTAEGRATSFAVGELRPRPGPAGPLRRSPSAPHGRPLRLKPEGGRAANRGPGAWASIFSGRYEAGRGPRSAKRVRLNPGYLARAWADLGELFGEQRRFAGGRRKCSASPSG